MNIDTIEAAVAKAWQTWDLERPIVQQWAPFYGIYPPAFIGVEHPLSYERRVELANPPQDGAEGQCFVFAFGAYGATFVAAWGPSIEDALGEAAKWLAEHAPGHLTDLADDYQREYRDARALGATDEQAEEHARETAETDMTYTESGWLTSWEWTVALEDPSREAMAALLGVK